MKKLVKTTAISLLAALALGASSNAFAHKVGVVDMQSIYQQLPQMAAIEKKLQSEFAERRQELEKLQGDIRFEAEKYKRESTTMSQKQKAALEKKIQGMQKKLVEKGRPLEQEIKQRQSQEMVKLQKQILAAIEKVAKDGKYDEVKPKEATIYFNPKKVTDLSKKVIDRVSKK